MDDTGCFWWALPDTALNQKGKRCRLAVVARSQTSVTRRRSLLMRQFVIVKEEPVIIGRVELKNHDASRNS